MTGPVISLFLSPSRFHKVISSRLPFVKNHDDSSKKERELELNWWVKPGNETPSPFRACLFIDKYYTFNANKPAPSIYERISQKKASSIQWGLIMGLEMGQISHFFVGPNLYLELSRKPSTHQTRRKRENKSPTNSMSLLSDLIRGLRVRQKQRRKKKPMRLTLQKIQF